MADVQSPTTPELPFLTVVMPVFNEERFIGVTLGQLYGQEYPEDRFEVLVVDGMSTDTTRDLVRSYAADHGNLRLLDNPGRRSSSGRNIGFKEGRGDYFVVVDGHCHIPSTRLFRNIAEAFQKSGADCLGRPQPLDPPELSAFQKLVALARATPIGHGGGSLIYSDFEGFCEPMSNGAAYSRKVFEKVGYVDETFDACEDVEFNWRVNEAGFKAYTGPKLEIKYFPRQNLAGLFKQMKRYGFGRYLLYDKHPDSLTMLTLVPPLFALGVLACFGFLLMGAFFGWPMALVAPSASCLGIYVAAIGGYSWWTASEKNISNILTLFSIFFVIHFGLGFGFLTGVFRRRKK